MRLLGQLGQWRNQAKEVLNRTTNVAKFLCFLNVTNTYIFNPLLVYGPSMLPTPNLTGDELLVDGISTRLGKVGLGDVVVARSPEKPRKSVTRPILVMEGDSVNFVVDPRRSSICQTVVVRRGHIWIQGDIMYLSRDSRHFGPVPYGLIQGKVFWRVWPLKEFGSL